MAPQALFHELGHEQERLRREEGLTVLAAMHDLTLAALYGDRVVLVDRGRIVADGAAAEVLTVERIESLYGANVRVVHDGGFAVVPVRE
jgi:iron complex transport system ATP-binding protein